MQNRKVLKKLISCILCLCLIFTMFNMSIFTTSAAETNVAKIGSTYYNSIADALNSAVSGDTVVLCKNTTLTQNATVKSGVTLLLPYSDSDNGYDFRNGLPVNGESAKSSTLFRTLTVAAGVTLTVEGTVGVNAVIGVRTSHAEQTINGPYAKMIVNGVVDIKNGGFFVSNGIVDGTGEMFVQSGGEVRDIFSFPHWRGGTQAVAMRIKLIWPANEYNCHNIRIKVTVYYGGIFSATATLYTGSFDCVILDLVNKESGFFYVNEGGRFVKTYEYRERVKGYVEVMSFYGGGGLGYIALTLEIEGISATVSSADFVTAIDGDYEFHFYDGSYSTSCNNKALSYKLLPGAVFYVENGATFTVSRLSLVKISTFAVYDKLEDANFGSNYRYPQGRPGAEIHVNSGGTFVADGKFGGKVVVEDGGTVKKGDKATLNTSTKEAEGMSNDGYTKSISVKLDAAFYGTNKHFTGWSSNTAQWAAHTWNSGTVTTAATCTTDGIKTYTCTYTGNNGCGATKTETISKTGHSVGDWVIQTPADCKAEGLRVKKCSNCQQVMESEVIKKTAHTPGPAATCNAPQKCSKCGEILAPATGVHTPGPAATCSTPQICTVCSAELAPATGIHTPGEEATCTTDQICTVCKKVLVERKGHTPGKEATCVDPQLCEVCKVELAPATGIHTPGEEATCTTDQICTVCKKVLVERKGHTPGKEATCVDPQLCEVCKVELAPATGIHTPGEEATCTTDQICTVCKKVLVERKGHTPGKEATCVDPQLCEVCKVELAPATGIHTPGEEATCTTDQICTVCKKVLVERKGHTPGKEATCVDPQLCEVCKVELAPATGIHTPGEEATCTTDQICTVCKKVLVERKGHTPGKEATCVDPQLCEVCKVELAPATGIHTPGEEATCTTDQICTVCKKVLVERKGHTPGKEATCVDPQLCEVCKVELAPATGIHTPGNWVTVNPATLLTDGSEELHCAYCQEVIDTRVITKIITVKEFSDIVIDVEKGYINGIAEGTKSLDNYITLGEGYSIEYLKTDAGFGTGTVVNIVDDSDKTVVESLTIIIYGDISGDGVISFDDASIIDSYQCYGCDIASDSVFFKAGDINGDGSLDSSDIIYLDLVQCFYYNINQSSGTLEKVL